jgi:hypothetical protein
MAKGRSSKPRPVATRAAPSATAAKPREPQGGPPGERAGSFRVSDILSALRNEVSVATAAAATDAGPGLVIANVDFELAYVVADADDSGIWVALHGPTVKEAPPGQVNRLRVSVLDVDVAALSEAATRRRNPG